MGDDERFGELRSVMHAMQGEARWWAVYDVIKDWPDDALLREVAIPLPARSV